MMLHIRSWGVIWKLSISQCIDVLQGRAVGTRDYCAMLAKISAALAGNTTTQHLMKPQHEKHTLKPADLIVSKVDHDASPELKNPRAGRFLGRG